MRICLVYDCLFPYTVGGAERWYRRLGERLAADGHDVTYLTLRQWKRGERADVAGVDVRAVGPRMSLYAGPGQRRIVPPLVFGVGVLWHLARYGRRYDVVHTCSFPYFSLLAIALLAPLHGYRVVVDWFEVWSRSYWRSYLGPWVGDIGLLVQRMCARVPQRAFCFSRLYARRLRDEGLRGEITVLAGIYERSGVAEPRRAPEPLVLFAGRHIPEKEVASIPPAIALARQRIPELRGAIVGDGPERAHVARQVAELGLDEVIDMPGFIDSAAVEDLMARALCLLLPSRREGYGLVVIEAAERGTPSIVVHGPDNAAVELIDEGENGYVTASTDPEAVAAAIVKIREAGPELRRRTAAWFARNVDRLSMEHSLQVVRDAYGTARSARS